MFRLKHKFLLIIIFLFGSFGIFLLIFLTEILLETLKFNATKNFKLNSLNYSYHIYSQDDQTISKLSRKFDVYNKSEKIPNYIKNSFIYSEDKRFLKHNGVDFFGLIRALITNIKSGDIKEGGSTITQQVARIIFLNNDLSLIRKLREIIISIIIDFKFNKDQILKLYLNNIYLGEGAFGLNEAAKIYFGKLIHELTLSEVALLAGLTPAPSIYSPFENYNSAIKNRDKVILSMYTNGLITKSEMDNGISEKITLNKINSLKTYEDKILVKYIINQVESKIIKTNYFPIENELNIKSSINLSWQKEAQEILISTVPKPMEFALISIESDKGFIRTFISGRKFKLNEFNRVTSAIRPLASTFKIIPYIAALSDGKSVNSIYKDIPSCWENYCPKNFSEKYHGKISLIDSFKNSSNIIPIKLSKELGFKKIIYFANLFGLGNEQKFENSPSLAIGSYGDSLINITNAYSSVNNNGVFIKPSILEKIELSNGNTLWSNKHQSKRIIQNEISNKFNLLLEKSVSEGNGTAASISGEKIYGKTGTSDMNRDIWFIGSLKNITSGIWIGFDDNKPSNLSSGNAAYIWKLYMKRINFRELKN